MTYTGMFTIHWPQLYHTVFQTVIAFSIHCSAQSFNLTSLYKAHPSNRKSDSFLPILNYSPSTSSSHNHDWWSIQYPLHLNYGASPVTRLSTIPSFSIRGREIHTQYPPLTKPPRPKVVIMNNCCFPAIVSYPRECTLQHLLPRSVHIWPSP